MKDCIFCQIAAKNVEADLYYEDENCMAFPPLEPVTDGHLLIVSKNHYENIFDIDTVALSAVSAVMKNIAVDVVRKFGATGVNFLNASGGGAKQSVFHFHIHMVPRYPKDNLDLWFRSNS